jgi:hypothetical protein
MPPRLEKGTATERVEMKVPATWLDRLDGWRGAQRPIPSRAEAIRILVDQALDAGGPPQSQSQKR